MSPVVTGSPAFAGDDKPYNGHFSAVMAAAQHIWDMGFDAVRFLWRYLLLGAVIVVPIWFVLRLSRAPRGR